MLIGRRLAGSDHRNTFELLCATTTDTDQMMVIAMIRRGKLKAAAGLAQFQLLEETHVHQQP